MEEGREQALRRKLKLPGELTIGDVAEAETRAVAAVAERLERLRERLADQEKRLVRAMGAAKRVDTGHLADVGSDVEDVPRYLERLDQLIDEALPEKQSRFREYLNRSSDQGVTQLLADIDAEVDSIERRIGDLNRKLMTVEYRDGRYLQLQPRRVTDQRKRSLDSAMRAMRSAQTLDDDGEGHFAALQRMVELLREAADNRRQLGSRALLDPRYRLQFFILETDPRAGGSSTPRSGSQSGSGGEKELMASHILTASLSYALCPAESFRPLHASVVLDEAFSKSSPSAARRIIDALTVFGLHPIFVTPNKEIHLLRKYTRRAVCVQRVGRRSSVASIRWEELDALAEKNGSSPQGRQSRRTP